MRSIEQLTQSLQQMSCKASYTIRDSEIDELSNMLETGAKVDLTPKAVYKVCVVLPNKVQQTIEHKICVIDTNLGRYWLSVYQISEDDVCKSVLANSSGIILNQLKSYNSTTKQIRNRIRRIVGLKTPIIFRTRGKGQLISYVAFENILCKILVSKVKVHKRSKY